MTLLDRLRSASGRLARELDALALACRDRRTPWYAKALALVVLAYALSPIDLVPDVVPVLGYLDDLILLPLGILLVRRLVPAEVMADCRARSAAAPSRALRWAGAAIVVSCWLGIALVAWYLFLRGG